MTVISLPLVLASPLSSSAWAGYRPINPSRPVVRTGSTATRGGCQAAATTNPTAPFAIAPLAPRDHIGLTSATRPTLTWYVTEPQSYPIELALFAYGASGRGALIHKFKLPSQPGMMQWTLPADQPGLQVGQSYVWQVALLCNAQRPSKNPWVESVLTVVELPAAVQRTLATTTDPAQRINAYADANLWYEAIAETLRHPAAKPLRLTLLQQLSELEQPEQRAYLEMIMQRDRESGHD